MDILAGLLLGGLAWFFVRVILLGVYTVDQNERAVKTSFGRAERVPGGKTTLDDPIAEHLRPEERERYKYPQVRVIQPGGPYFKMPWQRIHKVSIATMTVNMAMDLEQPSANQNGTRLEAVTKDQLNTGLTGQMRYRVSESNLYAFLFGIKKPFVHVMAYFVSVLRQRIANFEAKAEPQPANTAPLAAPSASIPGGEMIGVSINDLRKNLRDLNEYVDNECRSSAARYGVLFDASLITAIDPPPEVESALAAINTAHNQVSSDISLAQLKSLAAELAELHRTGPEVLAAYLRNIRMALLDKAQQIYLEVSR
jgi:regulator of protease activity HflC (stomatin/prohibitin superfamily)